MRILGIETSCDETAASLLEVKGGHFKLLSNIVASQVKIHAQYGGVVPEVAARNHIEAIIPVIKRAFGKIKKPDAIAVTAGPGLITSLLVGIQTARTLAYLWDVPLIPVNHIEGHIYANWLAQIGIRNKGRVVARDKGLGTRKSEILFPAIVLIVSGGHTELILMKGHGKYRLLGATRDDAAGECFDKAASLLGLGYPGGPAISKLAEMGDASSFPLPRPMIDTSNYEFSFSGLKTAVRYLVERLKKEKCFNEFVRADICASFQQAVIDVLIVKTIRAAKKTKAKSILMGGGVIANAALCARMKESVTQELPTTQLLYPDRSFCTDNAAMIAMAGYFHLIKKEDYRAKHLDAQPRWELTR